MSQAVLRFPVIVLSVIVILLAGCSSKKPKYLQSSTIEPIKLPEGADNERIGELYVVPDQVGRKPEEFEVPYPPALGVQEDANIASIQTMQDEFWVLNSQSAATTWSQLVSFLQSRDILIIERDLKSAVIETDWFTEAVQPGFSTRYRMRLERGLQPNTTEIYLFNDKRSQQQESESSSPIAERINDRAHANWLADQLVQVLNDATVKFGDSFMARTIKLPEKIMFAEVNQEPVLLSRTSGDRLDKALSKTLDENGFSLYEKNDTKNIYYFDEYEVKRKKSGLLGLISFGGDNKPTTSRYDLATILEHLQHKAEVFELFPELRSSIEKRKLSGVPGYLLIIQQSSDGATIYIRDPQGKKLSVNDARAVLDTIRLRLL
jgi:outer membrane protein assembly factor BamC